MTQRRQRSCRERYEPYCGIPDALVGHSTENSTPQVGGPWDSRVPTPDSSRTLRSKLSAGNTVQSSTSLLLDVSELHGRSQVATFTPTPELSDQGSAPSVPFLKERIPLPVTAERTAGGMACPLTCPPCLPCIPLTSLLGMPTEF